MDENTIIAAENALVKCFKSGGRLLVCGNGGSAADSAHIVGELCKGFLLKRPLAGPLVEAMGEDWAHDLQGGLPAIDLTANAALISAVANDIDARSAYAQQVVAYGRAGDVIIGISTSGNAENVRRAFVAARALGLTTIGMTGRGGGKLAELADILLNVDETETYRVQERHLPLYHRICMDVEAALFG